MWDYDVDAEPGLRLIGLLLSNSLSIEPSNHNGEARDEALGLFDLLGS